MENSKIINKIVAMQPELMSFAFKLTANQDSANDLVQDSILKALDNTQKFIRQENFKFFSPTSIATSINLSISKS